MNIPYEILLNIHLVHFIVGNIAHNRIQEKKDETCSKEQVMIVQDSL